MMRTWLLRALSLLMVLALAIFGLNHQGANAASGTVSGFVSEGQNLTLTAPAGTVFTSVAFASYGTANTGSIPYTQGACHSANSSTVVGNVFIGVNSASITADNSTFGDPCLGTGKKLAVTMNYQSTSSPSTFNSFALSGGVTSAVYRTATTISAEVSVAAKVTFKAGGVNIAGCKNKSTSTSSPFIATCSWKPSKRGSYQITAIATPTSNSYTASNASPIKVMVLTRAEPKYTFPAFAYGSVAFTSSTYLTMSPGISPGTSPFTIELWLKTGSSVKGGSILGNSANSGGLSFILDSATNMHTDGFNQSATHFTLPITLQPNTWYHIALVRDGSNLETVWIDGARSTSGRQSDSRNYYSTAVGINWAHCTWCVAGNSTFNGERITNLRVLVGTALYNTASTTITVPDLPLSVIPNTVLLLPANSSGTITVDSSGTQTITNNGTTFLSGR